MQMPLQTTQMASWTTDVQVPGPDGHRMNRAAIESIQISAHANNVDAQFELGQHYEHAPSLERNVRLANLWYSRAALQGHSGARDAVRRLRYEVLCKTWCSVPQVSRRQA